MSKPSFKIDVDSRAFEKAVRKSLTKESDMADFQDYGAKELISIMRRLVPVDSGDTKDSIGSHITSTSDDKIVNEVGPETPYSGYIEYGITSRPNYPIQPFVRPAGMEYEKVSSKILFRIKRWLASLW